ncbi:hypothetical protein [Coleofasciculus sp. FACHB-1120]|nr:hypothetical protein [Coleofasciculus sp. FACHB-1120]
MDVGFSGVNPTYGDEQSHYQDLAAVVKGNGVRSFCVTHGSPESVMLAP